jgi:hypothetical protein
MPESGDLNLLKDIYYPMEVTETAPASIFFSLIVSGLLLKVLFSFSKNYLQNRYRRTALKQLCVLKTEIKMNKFVSLRALPRILKETASIAFSYDDVASLNGRDWLAFLEKTGGELNEQANINLLKVTYESNEALAKISETEIEMLINYIERWIQGHAVNLVEIQND